MTAATAQDLATVFGTVKERVDSYNAEREQLAESLRQIIENAQQLLNQLGEPLGGRRGRGKSARIMKKTNEPGIRRGPGRPRGTGKKRRGRPKGFKMSDEARAKMRAAWARRKAASSNKKK